MSTATARIILQSDPTETQIRAKVKGIWESGNYAHFAKYLEPGALKILDSFNIRPSDKILDVACGAGQTAIPASRQGAKVTGIDIAENLIQSAKQRAQSEQLDAVFEQGDACDLHYHDDSFDLVFSMIGAMFAPYPQLVANELVRVVRPGGTIRMINWTPEGMVGDMLRVVSKYTSPPPGVVPPTLWGNEETVLQRFGDAIEDIKLERHHYPDFNYPFAPAKVTDWFIKYYGPTNRAYAVTGKEKQNNLRDELTGIFSRYNTSTDGSTKLKAEYLAVRATKR